jgi:hypothetical protein
MAEYNFKKDIVVGEKGEQIIREYLESYGAKFISDNKDFNYDLLMLMPNNEEVPFEIKTDVLCQPHNDTNNLFIEFECRNKSSGISVSNSKYFVTYYPFLKEVWFIKTNKLLKLISENDFKTTEFSGDGGSNTKGYLIPRYQHKKHFKVKIVKHKW